MTAKEYDQAVEKIESTDTVAGLEKLWEADLKDLDGQYVAEVHEIFHDKIGFLRRHKDGYEGEGIFEDFDL